MTRRERRHVELLQEMFSLRAALNIPAGVQPFNFLALAAPKK